MKKLAKKSTSKSSGRNLVTFELSDDAFAALQRDTDKHNVSSHHLRAREIMLAYLANRDVAEIRTTLAGMEEKLLRVAKLVKKDCYAVLVHAAKMDSEKANAWIVKNMSDT